MATVHRVVCNIAQHLPGNWRVVPHDLYDWIAYLDGPDGASIVFRGDCTTCYVHITGRWPDDSVDIRTTSDWGVIDTGESEPEIRINIDRDPAVLAQEIKREFLDRYLELFSRCLKAKVEHEAYCGRVAQQVTRLVQAANARSLIATESSDSRSVKFCSEPDGISGEARIYDAHDGTTTFRELTVPHELAVRIAGLLGAAR